MRQVRSICCVAVLTILGAPALHAGDVQTDGKLISTVASGTPPLEVTSMTRVLNLNADLLDGMDASAFGDGVVTIDQDKALAGGVTAGDLPGFPVTISEPGSYRLTSHLDISGEADTANLDVIEVTADDVTIDLNGFSLIGANSCTGVPVTSCIGNGSGDGIDFSGAGSQFLGLVKNGVIRGMGDRGIISDRSLTVENVRLSENGLSGISISNGAGIVSHCVLFRNGGDGAFGSILATDSVFEGNGGKGIFLNGGTAQRNHVRQNGGDGIRCAGCLVLDNVIQFNVGFGLDLDGGASYGRNMIFDNDSGHVTATGTNHQVETNTCGTGAAGAFACP